MNLILNKGHFCQIRNKKQKFKSLQTKYVISASETVVYGLSAYNDIQRIQIVTFKLNTMEVM